MKKTALLSVYNKTGIIDFANELVSLGFTILASGGTAKVLMEANVPVTDVATIVGEPILGHRVVTLSREVHAGLLALDTETDRDELEKNNASFIDLLCCDLYPLKDEVEKKDATRESVIEKTDIGGPAMIRAAAKGRRIVIADPADRMRAIEYLKKGENDPEFVTELVAKAEFNLAQYSMYAASYHSNGRYGANFYDRREMVASIVR